MCVRQGEGPCGITVLAIDMQCTKPTTHVMNEQRGDATYLVSFSFCLLEEYVELVWKLCPRTGPSGAVAVIVRRSVVILTAMAMAMAITMMTTVVAVDVTVVSS